FAPELVGGSKANRPCTFGSPTIARAAWKGIADSAREFAVGSLSGCVAPRGDWAAKGGVCPILDCQNAFSGSRLLVEPLVCDAFADWQCSRSGRTQTRHARES